MGQELLQGMSDDCCHGNTSLEQAQTNFLMVTLELSLISLETNRFKNVIFTKKGDYEWAREILKLKFVHCNFESIEAKLWEKLQDISLTHS